MDCNHKKVPGSEGRIGGDDNYPPLYTTAFLCSKCRHYVFSQGFDNKEKYESLEGKICHNPEKQNVT